LENLTSLLDRLSADIRAVDELEELESPPAKRRQYPPAKRSDIAAAERKNGFPLPTGYVDFLQLHNGWEGINAGDISVIGVSGPGHAPGHREFERYVGMIEKEYKRKGKDYAADLQNREAKEKGVVYLPGHVPVALNYNGDFWVIDQHRPAPGGEYEIVRVARGEVVEARYKSFRDFLEQIAKRVSGRLPASKRAKPGTAAGPTKKGMSKPKKAVSKRAKAVTKTGRK